MKSISILSLIVAVSLSQAIGIGPIGGGGGGTGGGEPITATVFATDMVTLSGTVVNGANQVTITITTAGNEAVATFNLVPDSSGTVTATWFPPVDQTYTISASSSFDGIPLSDETVAIISAVRPDSAGHITGGGWYNTGGGKDTMGFVAQVLGNGSVRGNFEFQDHAGSYNFKSTSLDWVYAPNCNEGFFTGFCRLNGSGTYRFFVHVFDNGEPGSADSVEFNVFDPVSGALVYSYSQSLSRGNVQIHCR